MLVLTGCGREEKASQNGEQASLPVVISANYPLHYLARRVGGDAIDAVFPVPADVDPAFWEPSSEDIARMQQADVVLLNGAGYEKWLSKVSLPESKLVDTSAGFRDQYIKENDGPTHQHGPGGEHSHGELAFTTWLDLSLAQEQARAVKDALVRVLPEEAAQLQGRLADLGAELARLDGEFRAWGESANGQPLIGSHPVYQYLARRYALNLRSVHWEPDEEPDAAAWRELDALLREHPARVMIWEGEPEQVTVEKLRERGIESVVVSPCANVPETGDLLSVLQQSTSRLKSVEHMDPATP